MKNIIEKTYFVYFKTFFVGGISTELICSTVLGSVSFLGLIFFIFGLQESKIIFPKEINLINLQKNTFMCCGYFNKY